MSKFAKSKSKSGAPKTGSLQGSNDAQPAQAAMASHQRAARNADASFDDFETIEKDADQFAEMQSAKQQVTILLNIYKHKPDDAGRRRGEAKKGFLKGMWKSLKSGLSKKKKTTGGLTKDQILASIAETFRCTGNLGEIAADPKLMNRIMTELPEAERNVALDCLYKKVEDPIMLIQMIKTRFGVTVVDSRKESRKSLDFVTNVLAKSRNPIDWTAAGLVEVYKIYTLLPQSDLNLIRCLMHLKDTEFSGAAMSNVRGEGTGIYYVNYERGKETEQEIYKPRADNRYHVEGHIDSANDRRHNTIRMDMTVAHELGHVVDGNNGWRISGPGSTMRNVSQWQETPDEPAQVVEGMIQSLSGAPFGGKLSATELEIAKAAGKEYLSNDQMTFEGKWYDAADYLKGSINRIVADKKYNVDSDELGKKLTRLRPSNFLFHLWRGQAVNASHYNHEEAMTGMKRPFHQGYANQPWYTFNPSAWDDKISCYQFRCPKEEFAETYASYHAAPAMGKKKGEMTPKPLLEWFLREGYGDVIPAGGASGMKEDKSH